MKDSTLNPYHRSLIDQSMQMIEYLWIESVKKRIKSPTIMLLDTLDKSALDIIAMARAKNEMEVAAADELQPGLCATDVRLFPGREAARLLRRQYPKNANTLIIPWPYLGGAFFVVVARQEVSVGVIEFSLEFLDDSVISEIYVIDDDDDGCQQVRIKPPLSQHPCGHSKNNGQKDRAVARKARSRTSRRQGPKCKPAKPKRSEAPGADDVPRKGGSTSS